MFAKIQGMARNHLEILKSGVRISRYTGFVIGRIMVTSLKRLADKPMNFLG
jgi:hypothetical protein